MAAFDSFKNRLESYAGDIDSWHGTDLNITANRIATDSYKTLVTLVEAQQPTLLHQFTETKTSETNGTGSGWSPAYVWALNEGDRFTDVRLGDYSCIEVPDTLERQVQDSNSIYYATATSPVYLKRNQNLYVYPTGGGRACSIDEVQFPADTLDIDGGDGLSIDNVSEDMYHIMILYTAKYVLNYKLFLLQSHLAQGSNDSDSDTQSTAVEASKGWEKTRWYLEEEEDTELAQLKMQILNTENSQIQTEYQWIQAQMQIVDAEYQQSAALLIGSQPRGFSPAAVQESDARGGG